MIALDMDGTILNYGGHTQETRYNPALALLLPSVRQPVAILTNQGGMAFSRLNPERYPSPDRVACRIFQAAGFLKGLGFPVSDVLVSCFHARAADADIQAMARALRAELATPRGIFWTVYTTERARKPSPFMLRVCAATSYYGDSPEDAEAAERAGIPFIPVLRYE